MKIFVLSCNKIQLFTKTSNKNLIHSETDSGLVKLLVMTNVFFNNQPHKIKTERFICFKQVKYT